jgi:hypothetical protein
VPAVIGGVLALADLLLRRPAKTPAAAPAAAGCESYAVGCESSR